MFECPERAAGAEKNERFDFLRRYRETKGKLVQRAESLKGKDETRRRKLLKTVDSMNGRTMSTDQIRRKTAIARLELAKDELTHRGQKHGKQ